MNQLNFMHCDVHYVERENHLVIASAHYHRLPEGKIPEFLEKVYGLNGMKIEGKEVPAELPYDCIETLTKAAMLGKPCEYISDKTAKGEALGIVLQEYGFPIEISEVYLSFKPFYLRAIKPISNANEMTQAVYQSIEAGKERYPHLNKERAIINHEKVLKAIIVEKKIDFTDINIFCNTHALYVGTILEYECILPDVMNFRKKIDGRIGVLVGAFHALAIAGMLDGNPIPKPPTWTKYKEGIPANAIDVIESIEQLVLTK